MQREHRFISRRGLWWVLGARAPARPDDDLLGATLDVAQTQLLAQIADETSLDGRTMGILAFNGALLAADVAARGLLGTRWWTPLVALGLSTLLCLRSIWAKETDLGPLALTFHANYGGQPSLAAREQLLVDLGGAFEENAKRVRSKTKRLRLTLAILAVGLAVAALAITAGGSGTMSSHAKPHATPPRSAAPRPSAASGSIHVAARGPWRYPQVVPRFSRNVDRRALQAAILSEVPMKADRGLGVLR